MSAPLTAIRRDVSSAWRWPLVLVVPCFIVGIALHSVLPHYPQIWLSLLLMFTLVAGALFHLSRISAALLIVALMCAGLAISQIDAFYYPREDISAYATDDPRLAWLELEINHEPRVLSDPF